MIHTLEADSIQLSFGEHMLLSNVFVHCATNNITGLLGRNGTGKSCLMQIIYGTLKCEKSVRIDRVAQYEAYKRPDLLLYLPQHYFIPSYLSLKRVFQDFGVDFSGFTNLFPEYTDRYRSAIGRLSGGGRRLVELYVILKAPSLFALLDEPFTHLSPLQIEAVKELLVEEKKNKGLLITDHMFRHVTDIADQLYVLKDGTVYRTEILEDIETLGYARL